MEKALERWPRWAEDAMQGIAFWLGHRRALYRYYPVGENALVAELCNLIFANLRSGEKLLCEVSYGELLGHPEEWPQHLGRRARADLVVVQPPPPFVAGPQAHLGDEPIEAVIEVKRASGGSEEINKDLRRLATVKRKYPATRAFLFVVSEAKRPRRFVSKEGSAIRAVHQIPEEEGLHFRVRRACKASAAFSGKNSAHYACILEVVLDKVVQTTAHLYH